MTFGEPRRNKQSTGAECISQRRKLCVSQGHSFEFAQLSGVLHSKKKSDLALCNIKKCIRSLLPELPLEHF
jgi:hypothetical protein